MKTEIQELNFSRSTLFHQKKSMERQLRMWKKRYATGQRYSKYSVRSMAQSIKWLESHLNDVRQALKILRQYH